MRVAVFDVSHWHFPLYVPALLDAGIEIVGVSDSASFAGGKVADELGCALFATNAALMDEDFDFALVFSRHSEMSHIAEQLIARGTPFLIEKPCGLTLAQVRHIRRLSEARNVYVSVPFIMRMSELTQRLSPAEGFSAEGYQHLSFRFIVGSIDRYERNGCLWMLDHRFAGGGSLLNVGVHFIDMIAFLTNSPITQVTAQVHKYRPDVTVEEQAVLTCRTAAGQVGVIETGYLYPATAEDQRDFAFSVSHAASYVRGYADQMDIKWRGRASEPAHRVEYNTDTFYAPFLRRCFADLREGRSPVTGLREAEHAIAVVEAGYSSAANQGEPRAIDPIPGVYGGRTDSVPDGDRPVVAAGAGTSPSAYPGKYSRQRSDR